MYEVIKNISLNFVQMFVVEAIKITPSIAHESHQQTHTHLCIVTPRAMYTLGQALCTYTVCTGVDRIIHIKNAFYFSLKCNNLLCLNKKNRPAEVNNRKISLHRLTHLATHYFP